MAGVYDPDATGAVLAALSAALRAVTLGSSLDRVLHQLAASARELVSARYAAIGVPEPEGDEFARFVTVGMSDELIAQLGPLPRTHGLLDAMLSDPRPTAPTTSRRTPLPGLVAARPPADAVVPGCPNVSPATSSAPST